MRKNGIIVITLLGILLLGSIAVDGFKLFLFEIQDFDKAACQVFSLAKIT